MKHLVLSLFLALSIAAPVAAQAPSKPAPDEPAPLSRAQRRELQIERMRLQANMHELQGKQHLLRAQKLRTEIELATYEARLEQVVKQLKAVETRLGGQAGTNAAGPTFDDLKARAARAFASKQYDVARRFAAAALEQRDDPGVKQLHAAATAALRKQLAGQLKKVLSPVYDKIASTRELRYQAGQEHAGSVSELQSTISQIAKLAADPELARLTELWMTLGEGWETVGGLMQAHAAFSRVLKLSPKDPWANFYLGRLLVHRSILLGATDDAVVEKGAATAALRDAAKHLGALPERWRDAGPLTLVLTTAYKAYATGDTKTLRRYCQKGLEQYHTKHGAEELWVLLAVSGDEASQKIALAGALKGCPHDARANFLQGSLFKSVGKNAEATKSYQQALTDQPSMWQAWVNFAVVLSRQGDKMKAMAALERAHKMVDPGTRDRILKLINHLRFGR